MRKGFLVPVVWLAVVAAIQAQCPAGMPCYSVQAVMPVQPAATCSPVAPIALPSQPPMTCQRPVQVVYATLPSCQEQIPTCYGSLDYLLFWIKDGPNPTPLLVAAPNGGDPLLGAPGATVLFGGRDLDYGTFSGVRATLGAWLDDSATYGIEGSGFFLFRRSTGITARSDAQGNPVLAFPTFDVSNGGENALILSGSGGLATSSGGAMIDSSSRLWSAEANGVMNLLREDGLSVDLLAGFRYVDLDEELQIAGGSAISVGGGNVVFLVQDSFATRTQFYGGQVGTRVRYQMDAWFVNLVGKVALGVSSQEISVNGSANVQNTGVVGFPPVSGPGGVYTQASNLGTRNSNRFGVVPEAQVEVGYNVTDWLRLSVGYNFLYWNSVVRPGAQIDRNVNTTTAAIPSGPVAGPVGPLPLFNRDSFYAHGLNFGVGISF